MNADAILADCNAKLDSLLAETKQSLATVEGPNCRRHDPMFNIANHPYYYGAIITWGATFRGMEIW